jgi:hypothetical protein
MQHLHYRWAARTVREFEFDQFIGERLNLCSVAGGPSSLDLEIAAFDPSQGS